MNKDRFLEFQNSIDKDLLEEAQNYRKTKVNWLRYTALAACFCAVIAGVLALRPWRSFRAGSAAPAAGAYVTEEASASEYGAAYSTFAFPDGALYDSAADAPEMPEPAAAPAEAREEAESAAEKRGEDALTFGAAVEESAAADTDSGVMFAIPNPVQECTLADLTAMGYEISLPDGAEPVFIAHIGEMAEVKFLCGGCEYLLRALKTGQSEDISGVYDTVRKAINWSDAATCYEIREGSEGIVFSWYSAEDGVQWCLLSRDCGPETLMKTAGEIRGADIPVPTEDMEDSK